MWGTIRKNRQYFAKESPYECDIESPGSKSSDVNKYGIGFLLSYLEEFG